MVGGCAAVRLSNSVRIAAARVSSAAKTSSIRFSAPKPHSHRIFRSPVELSSCLQTVQPFQTVNASALMSSTFVFTRRSYCWLPEDKFPKKNKQKGGIM